MQQKPDKEAIEKFKAIMLEDYGVTLSTEDAGLQAQDLLKLLLDVFKSFKDLNKGT